MSMLDDILQEDEYIEIEGDPSDITEETTKSDPSQEQETEEAPKPFLEGLLEPVDNEEFNVEREPGELEQEKKEDPQPEEEQEAAEVPNAEIEAEAEKLQWLSESTGFEIDEHDIEKFEGDIGKIVEVKKAEYVSATLNAHLNTLDPEAQDAVRSLLQGQSVDFLKQEMQMPTYDYTEEDLEDKPELQLEVIEADKRNRGWTQREIKDYIGNLSKDRVLEESQESLKRQQKASKEQRQELKRKSEEQRQQRERRQQELYDSINTSANGFFDDPGKVYKGMKFQKTTRSAMEKGVYDTWTKVEADLPKYLPRLRMLDHLGVLDGDLSKLTKKSDSDYYKRLGEKMKQPKRRPSTLSKKTASEEDYRLPKPMARKRKR